MSEKHPGDDAARALQPRTAHIEQVAIQTFGSEDKAHEWLRRPNRALGGKTPIDLLDTVDGTQRVEEVLGRIAYGLFS